MDASIDLSKIHINKGPMGAYGFRTGDWNITYEGREYNMYASIPHSMPLEDQYRQVKEEFVLEYLTPAIEKPSSS